MSVENLDPQELRECVVELLELQETLEKALRLAEAKHGDSRFATAAHWMHCSNATTRGSLAEVETYLRTHA